MKLLFIVFSLLTICSYGFYILSRKNAYIGEFKKEIAAKDSSVYDVYQGQVMHIVNPGKTGTIVIVGDICDPVAANVITYLKLMDQDHQQINLFLYTPGGVLTSAMAIVDAVKSISIKVNTFAIGYCYSSGTYILAAGTGKRVASKHAILSLHFIYNSSSNVKGDLGYILNKIQFDFWTGKTKLPTSVSRQSQQSYFLSPQEAKEWNIIDYIL